LILFQPPAQHEVRAAQNLNGLDPLRLTDRHWG
jgi:hypothetical protein